MQRTINLQNFTRSKPKGSIRIILDLSRFNEFVAYHHFKKESFETATQLVEPFVILGPLM